MRVRLSSMRTGKHVQVWVSAHTIETVAAPIVLFWAFWEHIWAHTVWTPRQLLLLSFFHIRMYLFAWLQHWTSHILKACSCVGAKAEFVPTDLQNIFWKCPSNVLILPCSIFLGLFFSWQFHNSWVGNFPSPETQIPAPVFFPDIVQINYSVNVFVEVQRLFCTPLL